MKDNQYDLAIVDSPYGINADRPHNEGNGWVMRETSGWDTDAPDPEYFDLLQRKSKNQIIWGANHFLDNIPFNINSSCWLLWNKMQREFSLADGELAWTSFKTALRIFDMSRGKAKSLNDKEGGRNHPTQKPVALYKWLLKNYAKPGDKIFDSHGGSMSHAIACIDMGFDLDIYEIDDDYYDSAATRIKNHLNQLDLTRPPVQVNFIEQ